MLYNPKNWYWFVGSDKKRVYSSAAQDYVDPTTREYVVWLKMGGKPTNILNEDELRDVLAVYHLPLFKDEPKPMTLAERVIELEKTVDTILDETKNATASRTNT